MKNKRVEEKNMTYLYDDAGVIVEIELTESDFYNDGYDE